MTLISTRRRATGAGVATGALVASALLFAPSAQAAATTTNVREADIAATATPYAGWHQGVANGKYQVVNEGLKLTGDSEVVRGYTNNTADNLGTTDRNVADLSKLSASVVTVASGSAKLEVDVFSDKVADDKLTTLSPVAGPDGNWTSSDDIGTGTDAVAKGVSKPLAEIVAAIGTNYRVKGFGVLNTAAESVVRNITFDDAEYTFANNAPVAKNRSYSTKIDRAVTVNLESTDVDGNALTYENVTVNSGTVTVAGAAGTFTPAKGFKGTATISYTVNDNRGGTSKGAITVKVVKSKGAVSIYRVHPKKPSVRSTVYVYATVKTDGKNASKGSTVYVYAKGKRVGTAKVNSVGKVKVKLPNKLPYGKATLKVTQAGSSKLSGGSASLAVRVRK